MIVQENIPLAPLTTLNVGGPAQYFVEAENVPDVQEAITFAQSRNLALFVLGGGSNLVISDAGWRGLVLKIALRGIEEQDFEGKIVFDVGAGEGWDKFVAMAVARKFGGIECLSGIPGSVGGTPVQNVGAYGQEVSETIHSMTALDLVTSEVRVLANRDCGFGYRSSIFNTMDLGRYIILRVRYELMENSAPHLEYAELKKHFAGWGESPTLADAREAVRKIRAGKGMLITPGDIDCRSAGSFFKNPVITTEKFEVLFQRAGGKKLKIPSYPTPDSRRKISAAWLIEHSGFSKGFTSGNVGISSKHSLAIINRGEASAADIISLKNHIQERVQDVWGIELQAEPVFVGF